ncbi:hypothetical protein YC2023_055357 [Brassica napus]
MAKDVGALQRVLLEASTEEKTVILTTLYQAWAEPNSTFDLFLEGFHVGVGTKRLLRHLVVVCMYGRGSLLKVLGDPSPPLLLIFLFRPEELHDTGLSQDDVAPPRVLGFYLGAWI